MRCTAPRIALFISKNRLPVTLQLRLIELCGLIKQLLRFGKSLALSKSKTRMQQTFRIAWIQADRAPQDLCRLGKLFCGEQRLAEIKLCVVGKRNLRSQGAVTLDRLFRTSQIQQQGATVLAGIIEVREKV